MKLPNFDKMSVDEIIDWKVKVDEDIQDLQDGLRAAEAVKAEKLQKLAVVQALANAGIIIPDGGSVTISPPPAVMGIVPGEVS